MFSRRAERHDVAFTRCVSPVTAGSPIASRLSQDIRFARHARSEELCCSARSTPFQFPRSNTPCLTHSSAPVPPALPRHKPAFSPPRARDVQGSFGTLYKGTYCGQDVAVKILRDIQDDPQQYEEFVQARRPLCGPCFAWSDTRLCLACTPHDACHATCTTLAMPRAVWSCSRFQCVLDGVSWDCCLAWQLRCFGTLMTSPWAMAELRTLFNIFWLSRALLQRICIIGMVLQFQCWRRLWHAEQQSGQRACADQHAQHCLPDTRHQQQLVCKASGITDDCTIITSN